jgi:hypothetical protein
MKASIKRGPGRPRIHDVPPDRIEVRLAPGVLPKIDRVARREGFASPNEWIAVHLAKVFRFRRG